VVEVVDDLVFVGCFGFGDVFGDFVGVDVVVEFFVLMVSFDNVWYCVEVGVYVVVGMMGWDVDRFDYIWYALHVCFEVGVIVVFNFVVGVVFI